MIGADPAASVPDISNSIVGRVGASHHRHRRHLERHVCHREHCASISLGQHMCRRHTFDSTQRAHHSSTRVERRRDASTTLLCGCRCCCARLWQNKNATPRTPAVRCCDVALRVLLACWPYECLIISRVACNDCCVRRWQRCVYGT